jgi:hypothetical protein
MRQAETASCQQQENRVRLGFIGSASVAAQKKLVGNEQVIQVPAALL